MRKKPSSHGKDKEDQNVMKSKPPLLDMKWENRDTYILKQANIPQFSRLDNIGTCLRLFESFFVNMLVDVIVGYTKLYGNREKAVTSWGWSSIDMLACHSSCLLGAAYCSLNPGCLLHVSCCIRLVRLRTQSLIIIAPTMLNASFLLVSFDLLSKLLSMLMLLALAKL